MPEDKKNVSGAKEAEAGLPKQFSRFAAVVNEELMRLLPSGEGFSDPVVEAMRYSLLAPGKRVRPVLTMLSAQIAGRKGETVLEAACAVEMIHTASLVLDDLPCMDDSHLRRGRKTLHRETDEATAVLAADALLMQAFQLIGRAVARSRLGVKAAGKIIQDAADCVGAPGMIGGQWKDLNPGEKTLDTLEYIHSHKTGSLFILSATLGARLSRADSTVVECLASYAKNLGLAFQITDDILNFESSEAVLGKDVHTDTDKATFVTTFGLESARAVATDLTRTAVDSLAPFGAKGQPLARLADYVLNRNK